MYLISITFAKILKTFITLCNFGSGLTWPGHVALKLYPSLLKTKKVYPKKGTIFVSATNGKTTTVKLISHILSRHGQKVVTNASGANLLNGVASALVLDTDFWGRATADFGVLEVDEFVLPSLLELHTPDVLLLLNLSRDQLDRYGETDIILEKWEKAIVSMPSSVKLFIDADQHKFKNLPALFKGTTGFFGHDDNHVPQSALAGMYNVRNVKAALCAVNEFGIPTKTALSSLESFSPAWGRGEVIKHKNIIYKLYLAKNPMSFVSNLKMMLSHAMQADVFLFVLNDNIPDGRDVSWIYDVDATLLEQLCAGKNIYISGLRAYDMAVRLQYAGIASTKVIPNLFLCIKNIEENVIDGQVVTFPNYSAMLQLRKILLGRSIL